MLSHNIKKSQGACYIIMVVFPRFLHGFTYRFKRSKVDTFPDIGIFLKYLLEERPFFSLKLCYEGDALVRAELDRVPVAVR